MAETGRMKTAGENQEWDCSGERMVMVPMSQIQWRDSIGERLVEGKTSRSQGQGRMGEHEVNESAS